MAVASEAALGSREHEQSPLVVPTRRLRLQRDGLDLSPQHVEQGWRCLHVAILAVLRRLKRPSLRRPGPLDVDAALLKSISVLSSPAIWPYRRPARSPVMMNPAHRGQSA